MTRRTALGIAAAAPAAAARLGKEPLNIYPECSRVVALYYVLASRKDHLDDYQAGRWDWLYKQGFDAKFLQEAKPVIAANQAAIAASGEVLERMVRQICYCSSSCPADGFLAAIIHFIVTAKVPLTEV